MASTLGHLSHDDPTLHVELLEKLGQGSYGSVYKVRACLCVGLALMREPQGRIIKTSELAAVKVLNLEADDANLDTILKEINILRECDHPNVVKYFGSYYHKEGLWVRTRGAAPHGSRAHGEPQIIMEYCGGGSIKDIFMRLQETLREDQISFVVRETLKGLVYMHSNGLIHRDMKGGNILVNDEGDIKLGARAAVIAPRITDTRVTQPISECLRSSTARRPNAIRSSARLTGWRPR